MRFPQTSLGKESRMELHKNACLTPKGRARLMHRIDQVGLPAAARELGISERRARIWYQRFQEEGERALVDRSSRPHCSPHATDLDLAARAVSLRRNQRLSYVQIAERLGLSRATVGRICQRHGVAHLPSLGEPPPKRRYERKTPGELLHLDTKKLARFARPGHRVTNNRGQHTSKAGYHALHVAIDDHSRVGFSQIRADETAHNAVHFTLAALRYYRSLGIQVTRVMTDNGAAYRSRAYARLLRRLGIRHIFTRPYTPRTNGKAERFIQTHLREWAYAYAYPDSNARTKELPHWIHHYNFHRPHSATEHLPPVSRLGITWNNVVRNYI
jgi:transposase InsO family protein